MILTPKYFVSRHDLIVKQKFHKEKDDKVERNKDDKVERTYFRFF